MTQALVTLRTLTRRCKFSDCEKTAAKQKKAKLTTIFSRLMLMPPFTYYFSKETVKEIYFNIKYAKLSDIGKPSEQSYRSTTVVSSIFAR